MGHAVCSHADWTCATQRWDHPGRPKGTTVFRPAAGARDAAAIIAALDAAAAHEGGGIVQLEAADYTIAAATTFVVREGVTLRGASKEGTRLLWGKQTPATGSARKHLGLIHGDNTTRVGWALEDLTIEAPQQDWMSFYMASATVADCGGAGTYVDGHWQRPLTTDGFNPPSPACAGMTMSRVSIVMDKVCAPGTAWPAEQFENVSCGGYTKINKTTTKPATASSNGIPPALQLFGSSAVVQDSEFTHYGTCGSNVARKSMYWVSPRLCSRTVVENSRDSSRLPCGYADVRSPDDAIAFSRPLPSRSPTRRTWCCGATRCGTAAQLTGLRPAQRLSLRGTFWCLTRMLAGVDRTSILLAPASK